MSLLPVFALALAASAAYVTTLGIAVGLIDPAFLLAFVLILP
jgi:hypothetical protein